MKTINEWGRDYGTKITLAELIKGVRAEYEAAAIEAIKYFELRVQKEVIAEVKALNWEK